MKLTKLSVSTRNQCTSPMPKTNVQDQHCGIYNNLINKDTWFYSWKFSKSTPCQISIISLNTLTFSRGLLSRVPKKGMFLFCMAWFSLFACSIAWTKVNTVVRTFGGRFEYASFYNKWQVMLQTINLFRIYFAIYIPRPSDKYCHI